MAVELPPDELEKLGQHVLSVLRGCKEKQLRAYRRGVAASRQYETLVRRHTEEIDRLTIAVEELTRENARLATENRTLKHAQRRTGKIAALRRILMGE